ncbi:hypothetical protein MKW92_048486 [Papaver armeniacum]|nr:hypothetical protein MKW92_048486 [Papaver armeniacum]
MVFVNPTKTIGTAVAEFFTPRCSMIGFLRRKKDKSEVNLAMEQSATSSVEESTAAELPANPFKVPQGSSGSSMSPRTSAIGSLHLSISQVIKATQNFSPSLLLGREAFGNVYRAQLQDGQVVVIKRATKANLISLQAEFRNEAELLSKIEHPNLVRLLGYVDEGNERIIISEFVPNGSLRAHLEGKRGVILNFYQRLEISIDVANALAYLHFEAEKQIVHGRIRSGNTMLTDNLRVKMIDFGFARAGPTDVEQPQISTEALETAGYLDPEYLKTYQLTPQSDVFSFGILLVEILTGRRPVEMKRNSNERITIKWAYRNFHEGKLEDMIDPDMPKFRHIQLLSEMFSLALECASPMGQSRPNMKEVWERLSEIRMKCPKE